tara:strand:- start:234 stop:869 length:636 start_codon:yes stop_codon:yes gene_type:complete
MYAKALFPIHIFQNNIKINHILKDELLKKIEDMHQSGKMKVPEGWLTHELGTSFSYRDENISLFEGTQTLEAYYDYVSKFFDLETKFQIYDMWWNYYSNGEWQEEHSHVGKNFFGSPPCFSCVHFLKFDSRIHEPLTFVDPNEHIRYSSLDMRFTGYNSRYKLNVREGDIVMFPSYLTHFVKPGKPTPEYPRITIAFNLNIQKYGNLSRNY